MKRLAFLLLLVLAFAGCSIENRVATEGQGFIDWCDQYEVQCAVTEFGTPANQYAAGDAAKWNPITQTFYDALEAADKPIWTAQWGSSQAFATYELAPYTGPGVGSSLNTVQPQATPLEANQADATPRCVALTGLEFGTSGSFSNSNPGTLGTTYFKEPTGSFAFLAGRGITCVRIGFRLERLQPTLSGSLDTTYLNHIKDEVAYAKANGIDVILDNHQFAEYITSAGVQNLGSSGFTCANYANGWTRLANEFKNEDAILGYELINEPHNNVVGGTSALQSCEQGIVNGIRLVDSTTPILVAGDNWQKLQGWAATNGAPWIANSTGANTAHIIYTGHYYWDTESSPGGKANSVYQQTYNSAESDSAAQGF
jgi:hypothetical protein